MKTKITNLLYSVAAAVVVFGAWAKIEHLYIADVALTAGLLTEVGIFLLYGVLALFENPQAEQTVSGQPRTDSIEAAVNETNDILRKVYNVG